MNIINTIIENEISKHFKPVYSLIIEEDWFSEPECTGEYSLIQYPPIMFRSDKSYSRKRYRLEVKIRFTDNTAMRMYLKPEDYLSKKYSTQFQKNEGWGAKSLVKMGERHIDIDKILRTILKTMNGEKVENPSLEMLDFIK